MYLGDTTKNDGGKHVDSQIENDQVFTIRKLLSESFPLITITSVDRLSEHIRINVRDGSELTYDSLAICGIFPHLLSHTLTGNTEIVFLKKSPLRFSLPLYLVSQMRRSFGYISKSRGCILYAIYTALNILVLSTLLYMCLYVQYINKPDRYHAINRILLSRTSLFSDIVEYVYHLK